MILSWIIIIITITIATAKARILLTPPIQHNTRSGHFGMWRWVISLEVPDLSKDHNSFIFKGQVVMDSLTLQDKGTTILCNGETHSPTDTVPRPQNTRPTHPKAQYRVPRTRDPLTQRHSTACPEHWILNCTAVMSQHAPDEALHASHCSDKDQHISCTDRQTFWITNLADKTDKALRPCVQFRPTVVSDTVLVDLNISAGDVNRNIPQSLMVTKRKGRIPQKTGKILYQTKKKYHMFKMDTFG